jgi:hypothetical protein
MDMTRVIGVQVHPAGAPRVVDGVDKVYRSAQHCLQACPECAKLGLRVGCNRDSGHAGVHHCSNYNQGPHEW